MEVAMTNKNLLALTILLALMILLVLATLISACGSGGQAPTPLPYTPQVWPTAEPQSNGSEADPEAGKVVFDQYCSECHSLEQDVNIAGPSLYLAGERLSYDYIKNSIANPHEVVVDVINPAIEEAVMPEDFFQVLNEQQIDDLIQYLLSLKVISPTSSSPSG